MAALPMCIAASLLGACGGCPRVSKLYRYPVKSARSEAVEVAQCGPEGFIGDRRLMVVRDDGDALRAVTQRDMPQLATIDVNMRGDEVSLAFGDRTSVATSMDAPGGRVKARLFGTDMPTFDAGDRVAEALSAFLEGGSRASGRARYRLVRAIEPSSGRAAGFSDVAPVLLISAESLAEVNARRSEEGLAPVEMARFRPNIVIDGCGEPFAEDKWRFPIRIGDVVFSAGTPCPRCTVPDVCQDTGQVDGKQASPMRTLRSFRKTMAGYVNFGMYLTPELAADGALATSTEGTTQRIRIGDTIKVLGGGSDGTGDDEKDADDIFGGGLRRLFGMQQ